MLYLPANLPAVPTLQAEGGEVATYSSANAPREVFPAGTRRVLFLNLMPKKAETELDIARMLVNRSEDVALLPMKIAGQTYKTTPLSHMQAFYNDFEAFANDHFDGLIITGAPVEHLPFEDVRYWKQLCDIMDWAATHVHSTLCICWGAQAALYHLYGIPKYPLPAKMFGIFEQRVLTRNTGVSPVTESASLQAATEGVSELITHNSQLITRSLMEGLAPTFPMPNSRHTEVRAADVEAAGVNILAASEESGVGVMQSKDGRYVFIVGHLEYHAATLDSEYRRDLGKGLPIAAPRHYYNDDQPERGINFSWLTAARRFYGNWLCSL